MGAMMDSRGAGELSCTDLIGADMVVVARMGEDFESIPGEGYGGWGVGWVAVWV